MTAAATPVSKIMTPEVISVRSGTSVESVVELMLARGPRPGPGTDEAGRPIGITSKAEWTEEPRGRGGDGEQAPRPRRFDKYVEPRGFHDEAPPRSVDEVMTRTLISAEERDSISRVAELMVSRHVHGIPVVSREGELVGFVSTMDVLGWLAGLR